MTAELTVAMCRQQRDMLSSESQDQREHQRSEGTGVRIVKVVSDAQFLVEQSAQMVADSVRMAKDSDRQARTCYAKGIAASRKAISESRILLKRCQD